jgi:hypothetical protein
LAVRRVQRGDVAHIRLFTAVLQDQHDEWQDGRRHFSQQSMSLLLNPEVPPLLTNPLTGGLAA